MDHLALELRSNSSNSERRKHSKPSVNSRSSNSAADDRSVTANFSGGGSATLTDNILTGNGSDNTFFSIAAPTGESILSVDFSGTGLSTSGDIGGFDDFGFVTAVVPEPATAMLSLVGLACLSLRRRA